MAWEQTCQLFCQHGVFLIVLPAIPKEEILSKEGRWPDRVLVQTSDLNHNKISLLLAVAHRYLTEGLRV